MVLWAKSPIGSHAFRDCLYGRFDQFLDCRETTGARFVLGGDAALPFWPWEGILHRPENLFRFIPELLIWMKNGAARILSLMLPAVQRHTETDGRRAW